MAIREIIATGIEALNLSTRLLQRARLADPFAGVFEAADIQWSWRVPRDSDDVEKVFWLDSDGPIAGIDLTSSTDNWQIDPLTVPNASGVEATTVWNKIIEIISAHPDRNVIIPIANNDPTFNELARSSGLIAVEQDFTGWMNAEDAPAGAELADGFKILDRATRPNSPHPMSDRNGKMVEERLQQCSLYSPELDLAIESPDGRIAGYSLYWFDPVTKVGLVEPVRVHDDFQRRGLGRAMVTHGINRLVRKGADRLKVSWETEAAGALYQAVGFQQQSTTAWYGRSLPESSKPL